MHIPDGYLNPPTCIAAFGVMAPIWATAAKKLKGSLQAKEVPFLAGGAAFSFVLMMFNVPLPGGSSGHAVGGALLTILLGPWAAVSIISVVIALQALLFHDGGLTTFGANAFNMAFVLPMIASFVYRIFSRQSDSIRKKSLVGGIAGYIGLTVSAFTTAVMLGIQPHGPAGYAPYPLSVTIPVMAGSHLFVFSWIEGIVTALALFWILEVSDSKSADVKPLSKMWLVLAAMILLSPLGLLANKTAFGEWSQAELQKIFGYVPAGIVRFSKIWMSPLAGYRLSNHSIVYGYLASALLGALLTALFAFFLGRLLVKKEKENVATPKITEKTFPSWLEEKETKLIPKKQSRISSIQPIEFFAEARRLEEFSKRNGFLQAWNPKIKTASFILLAFLSAWIPNPIALAVLIAAAFALAIASKIPAGWFLKFVLGTMAVFTLLIALPALFTRFSPGLHGVSLLVLRTVAALSWTTLLAVTTPWHRLIESLKIFKIPQGFLFILEMTFRYILLFARLIEQMALSKKVRTFSPRSLRDEQAWSAGRIAFLFKRSLDLSEQVYSAMISRGYH